MNWILIKRSLGQLLLLAALIHVSKSSTNAQELPPADTGASKGVSPISLPTRTRGSHRQEHGQKLGAGRVNHEADWVYILATLKKYYEENAGISGVGRKSNLAVVAYAHDLYNLAQLSYSHRNDSSGGWADKFTREHLLFTARDIKVRSRYWSRPPKVVDSFATFQCIALKLDALAPADCGAAIAAAHHLNEHVVPFFDQYISRELDTALQRKSEATLAQKLVSRLNEIRADHEEFLKQAAMPALDGVKEMSPLGRDIAKKELLVRARQLRMRAMVSVILRMVREGKISEEDARLVFLSRVESWKDAFE